MPARFLQRHWHQTTIATPRRKFCLCNIAITGLILGFTISASAGLLNSAGLTARDHRGVLAAEFFDNSLETGRLLQAPRSMIRCTIDLGATLTVHRALFAAARHELETDPGRPRIASPRTVSASVRISNHPTRSGAVLARRESGGVTGREIRVSASFRFKPAAGRYFFIELNWGDLPHGWNIG
jgi:hypothetical protein